MEEVDDLGERMGDLSQDLVAQRQSLEEFQTGADLLRDKYGP